MAANSLGRALYAPLLGYPDSKQNTARFTFLNPASRGFFPDWEENPDDEALAALIANSLNEVKISEFDGKNTM